MRMLQKYVLTGRVILWYIITSSESYDI